jgi:hypothetical protein
MNAAADWLDLLPWFTIDELLTLLDSERAAMLYTDALRAAGLGLAGAFDDPALNVLAAVMVQVHGADPMALIDGRSVAATGGTDWRQEAASRRMV